MSDQREVRDIKIVLENHGLKDVQVERKDFGTIYRSCGLTMFEKTREYLLSCGHNTSISCHREEGSCEAFMIIWNQTKGVKNA